MKKLFLPVLLLFLTTSISFANSSSFVNPDIDCVSVSHDVFDSYYNSGYTYQEAYQASIWAYEGCVSDGNYPGEVVVIE